MAVCVAKQEELEETSDDDTTALTEDQHKEVLEAQNTAAQSNESKKQPQVSYMLLLALDLYLNFPERVVKEKRTKSLLTQKLILSLVRELRNLMLNLNLRRIKK